MWQWSAYAVVCCDGTVSEHFSVDGNTSGPHFHKVAGKGSDNLRDRLDSAWAIAFPEVTASQSFLCDRGRQAGANEFAALNRYFGNDPVNSCWCGAVG